jgi:predicted enzyme related to lactoylglutathione lyase
MGTSGFSPSVAVVLTPAIRSGHAFRSVVGDIEAKADEVVQAGGQLMVPKTSAGDWGSFAVVADQAGATFALFEGRLDD